MTPDLHQSDVTGTVNMADTTAVADAVCRILATCYPGFDAEPLQQGFLDIHDAFWGRYPDLLACDTPYHDLRHSLGTALLMARMLDGFERARSCSARYFQPSEACVAVLLALYHDIGFLRRPDEAHLAGACLIGDHEARSVAFMAVYLARAGFENPASWAELIHATNFAQPLAALMAPLTPVRQQIACMLGAADLVSQFSSRYYLERCYHYLYREFVIAGVDRMVDAAGREVVLYASAEDLLIKTPVFYEKVVKPRLEESFLGVARCVSHHFGGGNPYEEGMRRNLIYLRSMIERNDFSGLGRKPVPLMPVTDDGG